MSRFFLFILALIYASSAEARIELPPIVVAPPSLTGYKNLNDVVLYWNTAQSITHTVIEESTNGTSWQQVYQGLGSPRVGGPEPMAFAQISSSKTELSSDNIITKQVTPNYREPIVCTVNCGPTTNYSRQHMLTAKAGSYYLYRAKNCSLSLCSEYSNELMFATPPPPTPSSIVVRATSANGSFVISWVSAPTATSYTLQESVNNGAWTTLTTANSTSYARSGLSSGSYKYQIRACNASGCSGWQLSNSATVLLPPPTPASINVPPTSTNGSVAISWASTSTATSYTLQESVNNGAWTTLTSASSTSYARSGLTNGAYKYQVQACNTSGCSGWSASSTVTVLLPPPIQSLRQQVPMAALPLTGQRHQLPPVTPCKRVLIMVLG